MEHFKELIKDAQVSGSIRLFSIRHEFPPEWAKFKAQPEVDGQRLGLTLTLRPEHYPFWSQGYLKSVARLDILAQSKQDSINVTVDEFNRTEKNDRKSNVYAY